MFFGISNFAVYIAFFLSVILIFAAFNFDNQTKESVIMSEFKESGGETIVRSFLRQEVSADVDLDGDLDVETMSDLVVMGAEEDEARDMFQERAQEMLEVVNSEEAAYRLRICYPNGDYFTVPENVSFGACAGLHNSNVLYLPLPEGEENVKIVVGTQTGIEQEVENTEVAAG